MSMFDEEMRMALVTIVNTQSLMLKVMSGFIQTKEREKLWDYAKELDNFSQTMLSGEQNDTNTRG